MVRWMSAAVAVALTVVLVWFAVGSSGDEPLGRTVAAAAQGDDETEGAEDPQGDADERSDRGREASAGHGPPPWAGGPGRDDAKRDKRAWLVAWQAMSPEQREQTMTRLAQEHAAGMRAWEQCASEGLEDCEKPLPPGLAKKQLGR